MEGAIVLTMATCVVKLIGAVFKIPLANILGGVGMSYFVSAYDIFTPLYSLTVTGLGIAVSRVVSEYTIKREYGNVKAVMRAAKRIFLFLGIAGALLLALVAKSFSELINNPRAMLSVYAIAPAIVFSCISSVYRGYYQGLSNMVPTAKSQVLEAVVKMLAGTVLSYGVTAYLRNQYAGYGQLLGHSFATAAEADIYIFQFSAAAAVLGVTLSTVAGAIYIGWHHRRLLPASTILNSVKPATHSVSYLGRNLIKIAIPISLSTLIINLSALIDLTSVMNCLSTAIIKDAPTILSMYEWLIPPEITTDILPEYLYGSYSGLAFSIFNLIPSLTAALGISALPAVTRRWTARNNTELKETISSILRVTLMIALPAGLGIAVLSGPILNLLFPARTMEAAIIAPVLRVMGISAIFVATATPVNSILQAIGKERVPLIVLAIGAVIKLTTNFMLVSRPEVNIQGVPYGTLLCYIFILVVNMAALLYYSEIKLNFWRVFIKPLFCSLVSAASAYSCYNLLLTDASNTIRVIMTITITVVIYVLMILLTKTITTTDIRMLPVDEKMVKTLEKLGLIS